MTALRTHPQDWSVWRTIPLWRKWSPGEETLPRNRRLSASTGIRDWDVRKCRARFSAIRQVQVRFFGCSLSCGNDAEDRKIKVFESDENSIETGTSIASWRITRKLHFLRIVNTNTKRNNIDHVTSKSTTRVDGNDYEKQLQKLGCVSARKNI